MPWLGDRKGIWPVKKLGVYLLMDGVVMIWSFARPTTPVVTITSVVLSSNRILICSGTGKPRSMWKVAAKMERVLFVSLFAWCLMALSAYIGYIVP